MIAATVYGITRKFSDPASAAAWVNNVKGGKK